jgi:hypothetical protein
VRHQLPDPPFSTERARSRSSAGYRPATLCLDSLVGSLAARPIESSGSARVIADETRVWRSRRFPHSGTDSSQTLRWREPDSNCRSRSCERLFRLLPKEDAAQKLDGVIKHRSSPRRQWLAAGLVRTAVSFTAGPTVRIRFPPAASRVRTRPSSLRLAARETPAGEAGVFKPDDPHGGFRSPSSIKQEDLDSAGRPRASIGNSRSRFRPAVSFAAAGWPALSRQP